jgi:hypothetical protein
MRRLSSDFTLGYKIIFPAIWLAAFGATTLFILSGVVANLWRGIDLPGGLIVMAVIFSEFSSEACVR